MSQNNTPNSFKAKMTEPITPEELEELKAANERIKAGLANAPGDYRAGVVQGCVKLNVRKKPSADAEILCMIRCKTDVIIDDDESTDDFYKIHSGGEVEGFCMKKYITIRP